MMLFPVIGLLLWIAFLFAVLVLCGVAWVLGSSVTGVLELAGRYRRRSQQAVGPPPRPAPPAPAKSRTSDSSNIWPKWTPSHRLYKNYELALWQEQFDALNGREERPLRQ